MPTLSKSALAHCTYAGWSPGRLPWRPLPIFTGISPTLLRKVESGKKPNEIDLDFPTVKDGVRGMAFIETVVEAGKSKDKWYPFKK